MKNLVHNDWNEHFWEGLLSAVNRGPNLSRRGTVSVNVSYPYPIPVFLDKSVDLQHRIVGINRWSMPVIDSFLEHWNTGFEFLRL